jgi:hypothetical protein
MQGLKRLRTYGSISYVLFINSYSSFDNATIPYVRVGSNRYTTTVSRLRLSKGTWKSICLNSSTKRSA